MKMAAQNPLQNESHLSALWLGFLRVLEVFFFFLFLSAQRFPRLEIFSLPIYILSRLTHHGPEADLGGPRLFRYANVMISFSFHCSLI